MTEILKKDLDNDLSNNQFPKFKESKFSSTTIPTQRAEPQDFYSWHTLGEIRAPILLYHHVVEDKNENLYFVSLEYSRK